MLWSPQMNQMIGLYKPSSFRHGPEFCSLDEFEFQLDIFYSSLPKLTIGLYHWYNWHAGSRDIQRNGKIIGQVLAYGRVCNDKSEWWKNDSKCLPKGQSTDICPFNWRSSKSDASRNKREFTIYTKRLRQSQ